jgi:hypothetical protein
MSRRSHARLLAALSLSLLVLCAGAAPARADVWNPVDPGSQIWASLVETVAEWLGLVKADPVPPPPTGGGSGGGSNLGCPPNNPNCGDSGGGADPFGRP